MRRLSFIPLHVLGISFLLLFSFQLKAQNKPLEKYDFDNEEYFFVVIPHDDGQGFEPTVWYIEEAAALKTLQENMVYTRPAPRYRFVCHLTSQYLIVQNGFALDHMSTYGNCRKIVASDKAYMYQGMTFAEIRGKMIAATPETQTVKNQKALDALLAAKADKPRLVYIRGPKEFLFQKNGQHIQVDNTHVMEMEFPMDVTLYWKE